MICSPCHRSSMGEPAMLAVINYDQFGHPGWIVAKLEDDRLMPGVTSSSSLSDITKLDIQLLLCIDLTRSAADAPSGETISTFHISRGSGRFAT